MPQEVNAQIEAGNPNGLSDDDIAFYDALESNEMKHEQLVQLAQELTKKVRANIKVD